MIRAIVGGSVIDGTGRDPIPRGGVILDEGRVVAVGPEAALSLPRGAEILDAAGRTILPGFIDCHVHATYRARDIGEHLLNPPTFNVLKSTGILRETLECGVTTARDTGGADPGFRKAVEEGVVPGPRLLVCIAMVSQTGGHGDCWVPAGLRVPKRTWLPNAIADGVDGVRRLAREMLMAGANFLKLCTTGGITSVTDDFDEAQFTVEEIQAAVYEAAARHRRVAIHAEGLQGIRNGLRAGVHSVEHGWFMDEECVDTMLARGTWWVPTLALVPRSRERRAADRTWDRAQLAREDLKDEAIHRRQLAQVPLWKRAVERGLRVAMGTDQSHRLLTGENLVELEYMVRHLGMSPMQAIVAGTKAAAECLERPDLGTLEPGKVADVVVVDGNPLDDIRILGDAKRIHLVAKDGVPQKNQLK
ncbi:MAG: amidohydrolase family protein [Candidatus Rokubacteria bacterium]|nr:amidohydrolase family protein [Candidatus Rokubacteria bacterium]